MRRALLPALLAISLPFVAFASAASIPAGFAPSSIFASETDIAAGDTISLFTVLYNSSPDDVSGDVVFTVDGEEVGSKQFSLSAGQTATESVSWTATEGSHTASAKLANTVSSSGMGTPFLNADAGTITLTVTPPPLSVPSPLPRHRR